MIEAASTHDIHELEFELGPTLVATLAGSRDRHIVAKWLNGEAVPTSEESLRLSFALEQIRRVKQSKGGDLTRSWFIGTNISGGLTPFMAIRDNNFDAVITSAQRFIDGTDAY